jgi:hypothetical protein
MGTDSTEGDVEHAVPIRHASGVRLDELRQGELAMEDAPLRV